MVRSAKQTTGALGEDIACDFLLKKGFKILERNYRRKWGELDIVAIKGKTVRFIEVKALEEGFSREKGFLPQEHVDRRKLQKLARTAVLYMEERADQRDFQIDVVAVVLNYAQRTASCVLIEQALEGVDL